MDGGDFVMFKVYLLDANNYPTKIKYGSKDNMNWKYQKDGNMYDFNNVLIQKVRTELKVYGK